ncbi:stimulator of interferon genes protein-like [Actinia tenebrosa]|uniref:Stimulator of interferon genes protein-like n=1 Tax=Actinia tenebrosa TaxID=6105 RepID=A0A6P8IR02_ACTTE|nr:stimulator of interferon genes protein-like [Actinia tenebrosa]
MPNTRAEENNGFGPLYKPRGYGSIFASAFIIFIYLAFTLFLEKSNTRQSWNVYLFAVGFSFLALLIGELIRRFCLFTEEYRHLDARYEGSFKKAGRALFGFSNNALVCVLTCIAIIIAGVFCNENDWASFNPDYVRVFFLNAVFMPIFIYIVGLRDPSTVEYSQNNEKQNKNLADGLAWSFYFGYLKFVLPALKGQINESEKYRFEIDVQKLFIILPKNCQVFDKISNEDTDPQKLIKDEENLPPLRKNRGGIQDRIYRHTVHSITERKPGGKDKKHYCVMEYATPLMTLFDMSDDRNAGLSREERDQQVVLFISKLKQILDEDKECKGKYELVTFSGEAGQDLAKIMIDNLKNPALEMEHHQG